MRGGRIKDECQVELENKSQNWCVTGLSRFGTEPGRRFYRGRGRWTLLTPSILSSFIDIL